MSLEVIKKYSKREFVIISSPLMVFAAIALFSFSPVSVSNYKDQPLQIVCGPLRLEVRADQGGRITKFSYNGREILTQESESPIFFGSTFWHSPQEAWGWPPYKIFDSDPYDILVADSSKICVQSKKEPNSELIFKKYFYPSIIDTSIIIRYVIINKSEKNTIELAPWEVTRVNDKGLLFFPSSDKDAASMYKSETKFFRFKDGYFGLFLNAGKVAKNYKLFEDGDGKVGFINDSLLFVKTYPNIEALNSAPNESEIELFINVDSHYLEIEQQGEYKKIKAGDSLTWQLKWYLRLFNHHIVNKPDTTLKHWGDQVLNKFK